MISPVIADKGAVKRAPERYANLNQYVVGCHFPRTESAKPKRYSYSAIDAKPRLNGDARGEPVLITHFGQLGIASAPSDISLLIGCTNLADKATMIWKQKLITPGTQADVLGVFNGLKEIRDQCAHPGREGELVPRKRLAHFVIAAKRMRSSLRESMQTHGVGP